VSLIQAYKAGFITSLNVLNDSLMTWCTSLAYSNQRGKACMLELSSIQCFNCVDFCSFNDFETV